MAKSQPDPARPVLTYPSDTVAAPRLTAYPDTGRGTQIVTLTGQGVADLYYTVGLPLPQDLAVGNAIFNISDRAAGLYIFRVP